MRCLFVLAFLAACTTAPETDTGQLVGFQDQMFAECRDSGTFTCGIRVTVSDGQIDAVGLMQNGTANGVSTTGALTDVAQLQLDDMISRIPTSTPDTVHEAGCGGEPLRATNLDIVFDQVGPRHFDIEYAGDGAMAELNTLVLDLVTEIRQCSGAHLTFDACQPNSL